MARAINDAGAIVGDVTKYDAAGRYLGSFAVRWNASGTAATELGNLGMDTFGQTSCVAVAINDAGTAVGQCNAPNASEPHDWCAVYYRADDGAAIDLNTLIDPASGWLLTEASSISDTGWIVGMGLFDPGGPEGEDAYLRHYLIHVPAAVPEPATAILFGVGLGGLGMALRRCSRRSWTVHIAPSAGPTVALIRLADGRAGRHLQVGVHQPGRPQPGQAAKHDARARRRGPRTRREPVEPQPCSRVR